MRYLYYTIYRLMLKIKTNDTPDWNAMFFLSILEYINIRTFFLFVPNHPNCGLKYAPVGAKYR